MELNMRDYPLEYDISDDYEMALDEMSKNYTYLNLKDWCNENMPVYIDLMNKWFNNPDDEIEKYKASLTPERFAYEDKLLDKFCEERNELLKEFYDECESVFEKYYYLRTYCKYENCAKEFCNAFLDEICEGHPDWRYDLDQY
jgi:hypothetical protein